MKIEINYDIDMNISIDYYCRKLKSNCENKIFFETRTADKWNWMIFVVCDWFLIEIVLSNSVVTMKTINLIGNKRINSFCKKFVQGTQHW